eukprot:gene6789-7555_t
MAFNLFIYRYFCIPNIIVALISIFVNSFLIHALRRLKKLRNISHKLFLTLCISDICSSVSLLMTEPGFLILSDDKDIAIVNACSGISLYMFCQFSALTIMSVAVDRYIHMKHLNKYSSIMTERRAVIIVFGNVMASILSTIIAIGNFFGLASALVPSLGLFAVQAIVTCLYLKAYRSIKRRTLSIAMRNRATGISLQVNNIVGIGGRVWSNSPNQDYSKSVLFVLASLWVFYTPSVIFMATNRADIGGDGLTIAFYSSLFLLYVNASLNGIIFIIFNRQLRKYTRNKLFCLQATTEQLQNP